LPYAQGDITSLVGAIVSQEPESLPVSIPEPLRKVIKRALSKEPEGRYKLASVMRAELREAMEALRRDDYILKQVATAPAYPVNTQSMETLQLEPQGKRRGSLFYAGIGAAALIVLALLGAAVYPLIYGINRERPATTAQTSAPAASSANAPATSNSQPTLAGKWEGQWNSPKGNVYAAELSLRAGNGNEIEGVINWTLKTSAQTSLQSKVGLSANELVKGSYNPASRILSLEGYGKEDANNIISLDKYRLILSADEKTLSGATWNHGQWSAGLALTRK
jgi:hypothetical protein